MAITLYTSHYRYAGPDRFDITVKGQDGMGLHFAPTWNMVMNHKKGLITDQQYVDQYIPMIQSIPDRVWKWFFSVDVRTLVCFCAEDAFCHRNILVNFLTQRYGPAHVQYGGFKSTLG